MARRVVDVLVPVALDRAYSYRVPDGLDLAPGDVVSVPLGPRDVLAVVWADNANPDPRLHNRLKDVGEKLDVPPLKPELRGLIDWVADYTLSPRGMVLRMALRMGEHLGPERARMGVRLVGAPPPRMTPARRRLIAVLSDGLLHAKSDAAREAGVSAGVIDGLVDEGTLAVEAMPRERAAEPPDPSFAAPDFSPEQQAAADALVAAKPELAAARKLVEGADCMRCHGLDRKFVGPGFTEIAQKYGSQLDAQSYLAAKIRSGSVGVWGNVIMPRHPQISEADSLQMALWVLSAQAPSAVAR